MRVDKPCNATLQGVVAHQNTVNLSHKIFDAKIMIEIIDEYGMSSQMHHPIVITNLLPVVEVNFFAGCSIVT